MQQIRRKYAENHRIVRSDEGLTHTVANKLKEKVLSGWDGHGTAGTAKTPEETAYTSPDVLMQRRIMCAREQDMHAL